jgi:PAS domain S-box-containing protein
MNRLPPCLLFSHDSELIRRVGGFLSSMAAVRHVDSLENLESLLQRTSATVVLFDLREGGVRGALADLVKSWPDTVFIALGQAGSEPMSQCENLGIYAAEELQTKRPRLQTLVARALDHLHLSQENKALRKQPAAAPHAERPARDADERPLLPARHFPGALRRFDNVEAVLESLVEGVAGSIKVARAGIFCKARDCGMYKLRAGLRCLEDTKNLEFDERDPLVHWLTLHAHLVCRANLDHIRDATARLMLNQTLDALGAEVIIPLQARERLLGWLFAGHRSTGLPFDEPQLENLMVMAEHVSTTLENSLLYEEVAVQKTLAETLLHSMPTGIVAIDEEGVIRWFNSAAQQILEVPADKVLNQRIEILGSRLADVLRRGLSEEIPEQPAEWVESRTKRTLSVQTRRLLNNKLCLGAVGLIQDITVERMLEEKEEQLERAQFWTELAASMSHEVRNPLVAIKTFAQLLPERYEDEEFRGQFSKIVTDEVDRLNKIIDNINEFAHPRKLEFNPIDIRQAIKRALDRAVQVNSRSDVWVDTAIDGKLPLVSGDEKALAECFGHLIMNAMEALARHDSPRIVLSAKEYLDGEILNGIAVSVQDNGRGIPADMKSKVFSPFCTTKARGMGLGLPIVKRTVIDHNGRVFLESNEKGTCVTIVLPAAKVKPPENPDESYMAEPSGAPPKLDTQLAKNPEERAAPPPNAKTRPIRAKGQT